MWENNIYDTYKGLRIQWQQYYLQTAIKKMLGGLNLPHPLFAHMIPFAIMCKCFFIGKYLHSHIPTHVSRGYLYMYINMQSAVKIGALREGLFYNHQNYCNKIKHTSFQKRWKSNALNFDKKKTCPKGWLLDLIHE